jgi:hypothetical protein
VAGARHDRDSGSRADDGRHPSGLVAVAKVQLSCHKEGGAVPGGQFGEPVPQGVLRAGTGQTEAGSEAGGRIGEPVLEPGALGRKGSEERLRKPVGQEAFGPFVFETLGQGIVDRPSLHPLPSVRDASAGADEDEPIDQVRMGKRNVQCGTSAHGVPHPRGWLADRFGQEVRSGPKVCPDEGGAAVARGVGQYQREAAAELVDDRAPGAGRLGEAVQQDQGRLPGPG